MYNHEPKDYDCPFCTFLSGTESKYNKIQDIVYQNDCTTAFIAPKWWVNNPGHVIVIPNKHTENIFDITDSDLYEVYKTAKKMSLAIKQSYGCKGISTRQHNEPAGNQDVWHLHVHVYPRYKDDLLYKNHDNKRYVGAEERLPYAEKLKNTLANFPRN